LSESWVAVGRVGRPHGRDGSFVVEQASEDEARFASGARVYVGREPATVLASKRAGGRLVVRLDRQAERGAVLAVPRD
jgi:ribosomal 30S subunit maturation factor RimM